jgi:hypothetical protein
MVLCLTVLKVWLGAPPLVQEVRAQLPDPALQRIQALKQAIRTNELLSDIKGLLEKHTFNVRIAGADNQADSAGKPRMPGP